MSVLPPSRMSSRRAILYIAVMCLCAMIASGPAAAQVGTPSPTPSVTSASSSASSCGPRVRRGWASLTAAEKQLYLDAVMKAISTGLHTLFHEVHTDNESSTEAHLTCGMIYWHRRFLLAYENMLRSLEPRFACITIPYWDYYADFAKRSTGYCTTLEGCSTFLIELGGSAGPVVTRTLGGVNITSNCVAAGVAPGTTITFSNTTYTTNYTVETHFNLSGFCESSGTTSSNCSRCMPRGSWTTTPFPSGFGYASLAKLISGSFGFGIFAQNLHYGVHNSIHNAAGSTMSTLSTSADPIFYNHHAMGDLVHQMWYDCQVKRPMTEYEKKNSNYAFATCSQSTAITPPSRLANITQYWSSNGTGRVRADDHPVLGQYFSPLPIEYWQYVSGTDLGEFSYSYTNDGLLQSFADAKTAISCPATSKARRTEEMFGFLPQPVSRTTKDTMRTDALKRMSALWDGLTATIINKIKPTSAPPISAPPTSAPTTSAPTTSAPTTSAPTTTAPTTGPTTAPITAPAPQTSSSQPTPTPSVTPLQNPEIIAAPVPIDVDPEVYLTALEQMALMECAWYVEQGGFIVDWTDDFKQNMNIAADRHSPEYTLIMKLISGEVKIALENWREIFKAYLQVEGNAQTAKSSPSGVNAPAGLEAVLDPSSSTLGPGALTEEAGVMTADGGGAADSGIVLIPAPLMEDV